MDNNVKNPWKSGCLASLLLLLGAGLSMGAIRVIYLGNIDSTPPNFPVAPSGLSTICAAPDCVMVSDVGSFFGSRQLVVAPKSSADGLTWTSVTDPGVFTKFTTVINQNRWMTVETGCSVWYSDDSGTSWTEVDLSGTLIACPNGRQAIRCVGSTCLLAGGSIGGLGSLFRIMQSTNNGTSWSLLFEGTEGGYSACIVLYYVSTNVIVNCPNANVTLPTRIYSSTTSGTTWTSDLLDLGGITYSAATLLGSTYYIVRGGTGGTGRGSMRTSTDLITWSDDYLPTFVPTWTNTVTLTIEIRAFANYSNPTMYYLVNVTGGSTRVYTSEDGLTFTQIGTVSAANGGTPGNLIQDTDSVLYFGTLAGSYNMIS